MRCPNCGSVMNHHGDKLVMESFDSVSEFGEQFVEACSCPHCGFNVARESNWPEAQIQ